MGRDSSFIRPRLYDEDDENNRDDVSLVIEAIDAEMERAMAQGDKGRVEHAGELKRKIIESAGEEYKDEYGD